MVKDWTPVDYIVAVITITISVAITTTIIVAATRDEPLGESQSDALSVIIQSFISIITLYVGAQIQKNRDKS